MGKKFDNSITVHRTRTQTSFLEWFFNTSLGNQVLPLLTTSTGLKKITAIEYQPITRVSLRPTKKKATLPVLHFGIKSDNEPWLVGIYVVPRTTNISKINKRVKAYTTALEDIATNEHMLSLLIILSDIEIEGPKPTVEPSKCYHITISWKNFLDTIQKMMKEFSSTIAPFQYDFVLEWIRGWALFQSLKQFGEEKIDGYTCSLKLPNNLEKSRFELFPEGNEKPVAWVRGRIRNIHRTGADFILDLRLSTTKTKKWKRRWEVVLPVLESELYSLYTEKSFSILSTPEGSMKKLTKKSLKKLEFSRTRLQLVFPLDAAPNGDTTWSLAKKPLHTGLKECLNVYLSKVSQLLIWPSDEDEVAEEKTLK